MLPQQQIQLENDEGLRLLVYDDATGAQIVPGSHVVGHPTIGYGRSLDIDGISRTEAMVMLQTTIGAIELELESQLPWFSSLDSVRQGVLINLAYNMGIRGVQGFQRMIADIVAGIHDLSATMTAVAAGDFEAASKELANSLWAKQVQPSRSARLIAQLRAGSL